MHLVSIQQEPSESAESEMYLDGEGRKRLANPCLQQTLCRPGQIPGKLRAHLGAICPVKRLRSCAHSRGDSVYIATKVATKEMRDLATTVPTVSRHERARFGRREPRHHTKYSYESLSLSSAAAPTKTCAE